MSGKCRKIMYALVVTVFAAFLWMICCENDRKVSDKAIGETTVQSMRSGEKTVSLEQSDIPKIEIEDLTDAFTVILQYAPKDMLAGCTYIGCRQRLPRKWYLDSPVILISQRTGIQPSI